MRAPALWSRAILALLLVSSTAGRPATANGDGRTFAVCFAPGTPQGIVAQIYGHLPRSASGPGPGFQFPDAARWSETATNNCCLGQGDPTTLTWSVVPDGTPIDPQIPGESSLPSNLRSFLNGIYGSESNWLPLMQEVFDRWGQITGVTYVYEPNDDANDITPFSAPGVLGVRGDVRIGGHSIDGDSGILAYNYFPDNGDMVLDAGDSFFTNTSNNSLRLRNTVAHEHGHGQGYEHVCPVNQTKLMEPFLSTAFDGPRHDDILAGNRGYGDDLEDNDTAITATDLGSPGNGTTTVSDVSADDGSTESDFYRFSISAPKTASLTLTPIGFTYPEAGTDPDTGACLQSTQFNSLILDNLDMSVLAGNGSTVLATANSSPAGVAETISNLALPAAGDYYVKVFGQSANNKVQLYRLDVTLANANPTTADLSISKTDGQASAIPGNPITYTITAANAGPLAAAGATVNDAVSALLTGATWTCSGTAGSSCPASGSGSINASVNVAVGGSVTFVLLATVSPTATGSLVNTGTVSAPPGVPDPNATNNSATDTDTLTPQANLAVTNTDGQTSAVPGLPITYTIVVTSTGPSTVQATVSDTPAGLTGVTWSCVHTAGSNCSPTGSSVINDSVTLAAGGTLTYTLTGTVDPSANGTLTNTVFVTPAPGVTDPNPTNNSATDTDTLTQVADVGVAKTDGQATAVPGLPVTYTVTVTNVGPSSAGVSVLDNVPAGLTGVTWTCSPTAGSTCTPSGSGTISDATLIVSGGTLTYLMTGTVSPSASGALSNIVGASPFPGINDPNAANNSATDTDTLTPQADLGMANTDSQTTAVPGSPLTYHLTVTNTGPSSAPGATVSDTVPAALLGATWTCSATAGSSCPASGSGSIGHSVNLSAGGTLSYLLTGTLVSSATGSLVNTAAVTAPGGVTDPASGNDSATDTDTLTPQADLRITKTDGQSQAVPGGPVAYSIVASNPGPSDAPGAGVADVFPASVTGVSWSCAPSAGASCGGPSGSGDIAETVGLPAGGAVTYLATGTIGAGATGTLVNTAAVAAPAAVAELEPSDNAATDVDNLTLSSLSELVHGSLGTRSLESQPGPVETQDYYWITQASRSSFEVVVDGATGSISSGSGPDLDLLAGDASTVVQSSLPAGAVSARSLRFENPSAAARSDELVRVRSAGCTTTCGPEAVYRIRAWETTYRAARFNNSGSQVTVLVVQNETSSLVTGNIWFRGAAGTLVGSQAITLQPRGVLTLNTSSVVPSASGSLSISHDGPYGALTGKAVAVEPATGFTFDTPLLPRQR